jgi:serine protease AprX
MTGRLRPFRAAMAVPVASAVLAAAGSSFMAAPVTTAVASGRTPAPGVQLGSKWGNDSTSQGKRAAAETGAWEADKDHGSLNWIEKHYGIQDVWASADQSRRKVTGQGVTVAVIDTGIAPVQGLDGAGKLVNGPDLSFESQSPATRYIDGYGHGTHMAGIIAGRDSTNPQGVQYKYTDPDSFDGIAPDAQILSVKVGTRDGSTDVTQVIAALDWVVQHRDDNGMNVRVVNLSYGTHSTQPYLVDPLARAVEDAWQQGIVVVVAAGNDGTDAASLTMPAADPYVISVGAVDNRGTDTFKDDAVAPFSNGGSADRRPDLLAPGKSVVSLRVPGGAADVQHPEGRLPGDDSGRFFRGSGTSQAAAVVSGSVALILQARPTLTPDQVKALLMRSADPLEENSEPAMGAGVVDVKSALALRTPAGAVAPTQAWAPSTGLGTLEASRGDALIVDPANEVPLAGEVDALGTPWDAAAWATASANGTAWTGGDWNGRSWSGDDWSARSWSGSAWAARSWSGRSWSGLDWQARSWSSAGWSARSWSGVDWSARSWSDSIWGDSSSW